VAGRREDQTVTPHVKRPGRAEIWEASLSSAALGLACLATFWLAGSVLSRLYVVPAADHVLGGLWAVIATIFVFRDSYTGSRTAAVSRMAATTVSFALCLIYLIFLPFHLWALGLLIALTVLATTLAGRPGDSITAAASTTVVMVLAAVSPHNAWEQPILRFADTLVGVVVGIAAVSLALLVIPHPPGSERT
jgi:putative flippase GtrA